MKIRIDSKEFYSGDKTTVCKLYCTVVDSLNCFNFNYTTQKQYIKLFEPVKDFHHKIKFGAHCFTVTASTKCGERDKFDEEIGRRIAESKAYLKVYKVGRQIAEFLWENLDYERALMMDNIHKYDNLIYEEEHHIDILSNNLCGLSNLDIPSEAK